MAVILIYDDLVPFAPALDRGKGEAMIADAVARATQLAPCMAGDLLDVGALAAVKAVLRGAILRWNEQGTGALTQKARGPFGETIDTRTTPRGLFWPSEIAELQGICSATEAVTEGPVPTWNMPPLDLPDPFTLRPVRIYQVW